MAEGNKRDQSDFNDAIGFLRRINAALTQANEAKLSLDAVMWFNSLNIFCLEISTEMQGEEKIQYANRRNKINNLISKNYKSIVQSNISSELYELLYNYEQKLRCIYKESGLQMRLQDDARKALK